VREPMSNANVFDVAEYSHPGAGRPHGNPQIVALLAPYRTG
jgi:hypothetical protein